MEASSSGKYGVSRNGWEVPDPSTWSSVVWKGILSIKDNFKALIKLKVGYGENIFF